MSVRRYSSLFCDADNGECGQWADVGAGIGGYSDSARGMRQAARRIGWTRVDGKDYCPKHSQPREPGSGA